MTKVEAWKLKFGDMVKHIPTGDDGVIHTITKGGAFVMIRGTTEIRRCDFSEIESI